MIYSLKQGAAMFFLAWVLVGCAGSGVGSKTTNATEAKDVVAGKAAARWEALIQGDVAKAYAYLGPGTRSAMPLDMYKRNIRLGRWTKATVQTVDCEAERCKVSLQIGVKIARGGNPVEMEVSEQWIKESSDWWYVWK